MTNALPPRARRSVPGNFALAVVVGVLIGLLTAFLPVVGLPLAIGTPVVLSVRAFPAGPATRIYLAEVAGVLIGVGTIFLYGASNTIAACQQTDDFCGNANVLPLLGLALGMLALGGLGSARLVWQGRK